MWRHHAATPLEPRVNGLAALAPLCVLPVATANVTRLIDVCQPSNVQRAPTRPNWATFLCIAMAAAQSDSKSLLFSFPPDHLRAQIRSCGPSKKRSSQLLTRTPGWLPGVTALIHAHRSVPATSEHMSACTDIKGNRVEMHASSTQRGRNQFRPEASSPESHH